MLSPSVSSVTSCEENLFTECNEDNGGLEQPSYRITITKILEVKVKRGAPSFPLLPSVKKSFYRRKRRERRAGKNKLSQRPAPRPQICIEIFVSGVDEIVRPTFGPEDGDHG